MEAMGVAKSAKKSAKKQKPKTFSCGKCPGEDTKEMVECGQCLKWYHFQCVDVTSDIQNVSWNCGACDSSTQGEHTVNTIKNKSLPSTSSRRSKIDLQMQRLEEEQKLAKEYLRKKYKLLQKLNDDLDQSSDSSVSEDKNKSIHRWLNIQSHPPQDTVAQVAFPNQNTSSAIQLQQLQERGHNTTRQGKTDLQSLEIATNCKNTPSDSCNFAPRRLSPDQIAARQVISKDLRPFTGRLEEWPGFISNFENTTEICGYSDAENMDRLQKCLKGPALDIVRYRLNSPAGVVGAIEALRQIYGRPDLLIEDLISRIKQEPSPKIEKLDTVVFFAQSVQNVAALMESSGLHDHLRNPSLLKELVDKLPSQMKLEWVRHKNSMPFSTISTFSKWISNIGKDASEVTPLPTSVKTNARNRNYINIHTDDTQGDAEQNNNKCIICHKNCVEVGSCTKFKQLNRIQRWNEVKKNNLCRMCLRCHNNKRCMLNKPCGLNECNRRHHPLLHNPNTEMKSDHNLQSSRTSVVNQHSRYGEESSVLFRIIPVVLQNHDVRIHTFAFLDEGSSLTLMDESIADEMKLTGTKQPICLKWTGDTERLEKDSKKVTLQISGIEKQSYGYTIANVHTVRDLNLPVQTIDATDLGKRFQHLRGLPVNSYNQATARILIGLNNWHVALPLKSKEGSMSEPIASKTRLGWMIYGPYKEISQSNLQSQYHLHLCECQEENDQSLHQLVKSFFSIDSMGVEKPEAINISNDDRQALEILQTTTKRRGCRYETGLLWKYTSINLPDSSYMAMRRLRCLEKKLSRAPDLRDVVQKRIADHIEKGYIRKLSEEELSLSHPRVWYLPIFPVSNPNKPGKVRIVWDAAAKVNGISLNDMLLRGPDQLSSLISILLRFRQKAIAVCGDIREMFHQVVIREEDQHSQRFLWRTKESEKPDTYIMRVMTFGATCSPSSAQYIKNINASNFKNKFPRAADAIINDHYVDDFLVSVDTSAEAIQLAEEVRYVHNQGGFEIHNWLSNSRTFMEKFKDLHSLKKDLSIVTEQTPEKVLGMWWSTRTDTFTYTIAFNGKNKELLTGQKTPTKREVLRVLMSIYDPLGLLAHFLIYAKIILQDIWRSNINWDDLIQEGELLKWKRWLELLPQVQSLQIPRCFVQNDPADVANIQLHLFVDASDSAYAAVAYLRVDRNTSVSCHLVAAKTRVAPLKNLSIPRMELEAALLGVRLAASIKSALTIKISSRHFWTDSKVVMAWLQSDQRKYRQYVAFRVNEILEETEISEWQWIPSKLNAADVATKWKPPPDLRSNSLWYTGPEFLYLSREHWPNQPLEADTTEELKAGYMLVHKVINKLNIISTERFSDWKSLVKSCAFVFRYVTNLRNRFLKLPALKGNLTREEYVKAEGLLYRQAQSECYSNDIHLLKQNKHMSPQSSLYRLNPYLDENQVLRIHGRIDASDVSQETKRPIILPTNHDVTKLLIGFYHKRYCHLNQETIVNEIRQRFYIPRLRVAVKMEKKHCQYCKNVSATPNPPMMSSLPSSRLASFTRPFSYVGVDYFGPMSIKIGRRIEKRWGVLLTCLTTRAIHLELAASLSTDSCILSLRRFMARRGTPLEIYSDNGTNFRGANREFQEAYQKMKHQDIAGHFTDSSTQWKFIPPLSPHMGGCWERLVRSVKTNLVEVLKTKTPAEEELHSALLEIEAIINSRPLTYIPLESDEDEALTPNHFLLGSSSGSKPIGKLTDDGIILRKSWTRAEQIANRFWKRWTSEYLPTLTRRSKWFNPVKPVEKGDIVVIVDPSSPRNSWPKGIVLDTIVGKDNQVRQATVRTTTGIYTRPTVKLAVLDVRDTADEEFGKAEQVSAIPGGSVGGDKKLK